MSRDGSEPSGNMSHAIVKVAKGQMHNDVLNESRSEGMRNNVSYEGLRKYQNLTSEITQASESIQPIKFVSIEALKNQSRPEENRAHNKTIQISTKGNPNHYPNLSIILESRYEKSLHNPRPTLRDLESIEVRGCDKQIVQRWERPDESMDCEEGYEQIESMIT